jgi:isopentenyl phosphate kinase
LRLVLGHGSGSFGHYAVHDHLNASDFPTATEGRPRSDISYWQGFAEVWYRASQLNRHVIDALHEARVPAISHAPSSAATSSGGVITSWGLSSLRAALASGVLPLIFGDVVFDDRQGGKVLSTEVLMWHLAHELQPRRILLAGLEAAVWADFPARTSPIAQITPSTFEEITDRIGGSHGPDVTGGMKSKVAEMLSLVQAVPGLSVRIFSGEEDGNIRRALQGERVGTLIASD